MPVALLRESSLVYLLLVHARSIVGQDSKSRASAAQNMPVANLFYFQGAAAVLEFYAIESPLAQPRNAVLGQVLAALVGVGVAKLFQLSDRFDEIRWLGGALACASATAVMALTKTVHPPAGATALLAVVDRDVAHLGWYLLPVMLLGSGLMLAVALLLNNVERQFPVYWWTPLSLSRRRSGEEQGEKTMAPVVSRGQTGGDGDDGGTLQAQRKRTLSSSDDGTEKTGSTLGADQDDGLDLDLEAGSGASTGRRKSSLSTSEIVIRPGFLHVPEHLYLRQEEMQYLEMLSQRLE
jgi:hypothetical protein